MAGRWDYNYSSGLDDSLSRLSSLSDNSGTLETYDYLGLGTVVRRAHPEIGVDLTYIKQTGESNGDAGDQYTGLDRFGRIVDQRWLQAASGTATDDFQYGYDRDSNVLYRNNVVDAVFSELYAYDNLNQLTGFVRGVLSDSNSDGILDTVTSPSQSQSWNLDAMGNWSGVTTEDRTHNAQNEITAVDGTNLSYDGNGNLTTDESGKQFVYDAWNRLVQVKDSSSVTLAGYNYDALNRRVTETHGTSRELYYSANWQVVEERESGLVVVQNVWSPVYVDALLLRDRDTNSDGTLDERLYAQQDANWNVTALVNTSGNVVERNAYTPYGVVTVLDANWVARSSSAYDWMYLHQGKRFDVTVGLYDSRERVEDPALGRPLQADPLSYGAGDTNLYRWEGNAPLGILDPSGLQGVSMGGMPIPTPSPVWGSPPRPGIAPPTGVPGSIIYPRIGDGIGGIQPLSPSPANFNTDELITDLLQLGLDIGGIFEPTPFCDIGSGFISGCRGDLIGVGCSLAGTIPYLGDIAKFFRIPHHVARAIRAVQHAANNPHFARLAQPAFEQLHTVLARVPLDRFGYEIATELRRLRDQVGVVLGRWNLVNIPTQGPFVNQIARRGWINQTITDTVQNPFTTRATINRATGNPATAYFNLDGSYVVIDDITRDLVQTSNRLDPNWIPDRDIVNPYRP